MILRLNRTDRGFPLHDPSRSPVKDERSTNGAPAPLDATHIDVLGARVHNLKNIDVRIPRDRLVVITGLSGSGKSSLAFDTIHAEGQRREHALPFAPTARRRWARSAGRPPSRCRDWGP